MSRKQSLFVVVAILLVSSVFALDIRFPIPPRQPPIVPRPLPVPFPIERPPRIAKIELYENYTHAGSGCPWRSVEASIISGLTTRALRIALSENAVYVGPQRSIVDSRKNCQINFYLNVAPGHQFRVSATEFAGSINLEDGVEAEQRSTSYFKDSLEMVKGEMRMRGPMTAQPYSSVQNAKQEVWSSCSESQVLNVNMQNRISDPQKRNATGYIGYGEDGKMTHTLELVTRKC
ncbi:hypothetical protein BKA69DRAFT_416049 [Paraphysoderma sedebokerense]|nr:hypothetical protein BKA69DRAFT_416049 [Paraphysoderma sedebokerense]